MREASGAIAINAPKAARTLRLALKDIRVSAEKTRKSLKEDSLRRGKAIDGINAILEIQLLPIEKAMEDIEKAEEIAEAKRKEALKADRIAELSPFADPTFYDLGGMPSVQYAELLSGAKAAHAAKIAAAEKAEADRIAAEKAAAEAEAKRLAEERAERERMREENARLAAVAAKEREERLEAERVAAAERAKIEAQAAIEREAARKEREEAARLAAAERKKREEAEAELLAKQKAEADKIVAQKAADKKAAAAPDKEKIAALAVAFSAVAIPDMATNEGKELRKKIAEQVSKLSGWILAEGGKL